MTVTQGYRDYLAGQEGAQRAEDFWQDWQKNQFDPLLNKRRDSFYGMDDNLYKDVMNEYAQAGSESPWSQGFDLGHFERYGETPGGIGRSWQDKPEIKQRYPHYRTPEAPPAPVQQTQNPNLWDKAKGLFKGDQAPQSTPAPVPQPPFSPSELAHRRNPPADIW